MDERKDVWRVIGTETRVGGINMADSWLIDGNCEVCRRKNYCKKKCKLFQVRASRTFYNQMLKATGADKMLNIMDKAGVPASEYAERAAQAYGMLK